VIGGGGGDTHSGSTRFVISVPVMINTDTPQYIYVHIYVSVAHYIIYSKVVPIYYTFRLGRAETCSILAQT
jgi:hypothetical protein